MVEICNVFEWIELQARPHPKKVSQYSEKVAIKVGNHSDNVTGCVAFRGNVNKAGSTFYQKRKQ